MWKALFEILRLFYISDQPIFVYWLFFTHSSLWHHQLQIESENEQIPSIWFSMGIDHSNPFIHSTTLLCYICYLQLSKTRYRLNFKCSCITEIVNLLSFREISVHALRSRYTRVVVTRSRSFSTMKVWSCQSDCYIGVFVNTEFGTNSTATCPGLHLQRLAYGSGRLRSSLATLPRYFRYSCTCNKNFTVCIKDLVSPAAIQI